MRDKRANAAVARAIESGELKAPGKCELCGRSEKPLRAKLKRTIWAHHDDYSKPLVVRWLCPSCHKLWHRSHAPVENYLPVRVVKKLTTEQMEEIRYLHSIGLSLTWIAGDVGCSRATAWRVLKGKPRA